MREKNSRNIGDFSKKIKAFFFAFYELKDIISSNLNSLHDSFFRRIPHVYPQPLPLDTNQHTMPKQDGSHSVDKVICNCKFGFKFFNLRNKLFMRHGSTLSIVSRSELERLEKRGLEVKG